jgi:hypothetical protein
MQLQDLGLI